MNNRTLASPLASGLLTLTCAMGAAHAAMTDVTFGGRGSGNGKFDAFQDFCFDAKGNLHALDGVRRGAQANQFGGNNVVQIFDNDGKFLRQFSINDETLDTDEMKVVSLPAKIAVDSAGNVFISYPDSNEVVKFGPRGQLDRGIQIPGAHGVCVFTRDGKERVAVVASRGQENIREIQVFDPATCAMDAPVKLSSPVRAALHITTDKEGNFYILSSGTNSIKKYSPAGALLLELGGANTRDGDGSTFLFNVAVDSKGNIFSVLPDRLTVTVKVSDFSLYVTVTVCVPVVFLL